MSEEEKEKKEEVSIPVQVIQVPQLPKIQIDWSEPVSDTTARQRSIEIVGNSSEEVVYLLKNALQALEIVQNGTSEVKSKHKQVRNPLV